MKKETYSEYKQEAERQREITRDQIVEACGSLNDTALLDCLNEAIKTHDREQATNEDLQAQQDMALWGLWMVLVGILSSGFSLIGIGLLYLTLREAAATTKAALLSARQAENSNGLLEKHHRFAYPPRYHLKQIRLPLHEWVQPDRRRGAIYIFNTGHGPSKMRISTIVFHAGKHPPAFNPFGSAADASQLVPRGETFDLRQGKWWEFTGEGCFATPAQIREAIEGKNQTRFFMIGRIHYLDTDNYHRQVLFCRVYDPKCKRFVATDDPDYEYQT